jgi:hypothetical protein
MPEEDREVTFVFDDEDAELVDLEADAELEEDAYPERVYHLQSETTALLRALQASLTEASTPEQIRQLNDQLVDFQSKILSANAEKLKAREEQNKSILEMIHTAECVDLCFVVDATMSMKHMILIVKDNIRIIVREIHRTNPNLKLRLAIVVYRDLHYRERYEVLDFVDSLKEFEDFVCTIETPRAPYGRDEPEDMAIGIQQANSLSWSQPTRITYIVADSPCHGFEFHNMKDNFPLGTPGIDIKKELRSLIGSHGSGTISVYFGKVRGCTDTMIRRFLQYGITLAWVNFRLTPNIVSSVAEGVRSSVFKTVTTLKTTQSTGLLLEENEARSVPENISQKKYKIIERKPAEEELLPAALVYVYKNKPVGVESIRLPASIGRLAHQKVLRRASFPFAEDASRHAYYGLLSSQLSKVPYPVVLKSFKFMGLHVNDRKHYLRQMEVSNVAQYLARQFNNSSARPPRSGFVNILHVCVIEEEDTENEEFGIRRFCAEPLLPADGSKFIRFSSNTGYWEEKELSETLLRFCKFTYDTVSGIKPSLRRNGLV